MTHCESCEERRQKLLDAIFEGKLAAAMGHAVKGAAEIVGVKEKEPPSKRNPKDE